MFRSSLDSREGLLFIERRASRLNTTIHMLFMFIPIGVVWLDGHGRVVDTCLARPWHILYTPRGSAQYVLETTPAILQRVTLGDELEWIKVDEPINRR